MRIHLLALVSTMFLFSSACHSGHGDASEANLTCAAGYLPVSGACLKLCESDFDCGSGQICEPGSAAADYFCVAGRRTGVPQINGFDGDGTADGADGHAAHHLKQTLVVTGEHFDGVAVDFSSPSGVVEDILVTSRATNRLEVLLPTTMNEAGTYVLQVRGQAGSASGSFNILQGEVGETGFPGASHITRVVLYSTTNTTDTSSTAILLNNPNNQISDEHAFPSGGAAGVMLTALNRVNHTLVTNPAAGSWFTDPAALLAALNNLTDGAFVVLTARGDVSSWLRSNNAPTTLASKLVTMGAAPGVHLLGLATPAAQGFVFAGRTGLGAGNGVFIASDSEAGTSLTLVDGDIVGASSVNYGVCVKDNANCTVPVANIVGTIDAAQLPQGLQNLSISSTSNNGAVTITSSAVNTTGTLAASGNISTSGNITASSGSLSAASAAFGNNAVTINGSTGAISATTGTISGDMSVSGNMTVSKGLTVTGNLSTTTCDMGSAAGTPIGAPVVWSSGGTSPNNHCYGLFSSATAISWYDAQLNCNKIGAHLATVMTTDEQAFLNTGLLASATSGEYWIGLSAYETGAGRWVGVDAATTGAVTLTSSGNDRCATIQLNQNAANTRGCTAAASITKYICERRRMPIVQPCVSTDDWWPINGGRLCMDANLRPGQSRDSAEITCQSQAASARVCSYDEMMQACGAGMNPFSLYANNVLAVQTANIWFQPVSDDYYFSLNSTGLCANSNPDGTAARANAYRFRCCY